MDAQEALLNRCSVRTYLKDPVSTTASPASVYQFETKEDAESYVQSDVIDFLKNLPTIEGEVTCKIYGLYREQYKSPTSA